MDIISEFESQLQNIWWEKVYSARGIMHIFWYDKWERFYGAINRAKNDLGDIEKINKNFFFIIEKNTWGRPKWDVLLTLWACYLVLKKCDNRKENIITLSHYLKSILDDEKIKEKQSINFNWEKVFIYLCVLFLWVSCILYLKFYFEFDDKYVKNQYIYDLNKINTTELIQEKKKEQKVMNEYDKKISDIKLNQIKNNEVESKWNILDFWFSEYIKKWWAVIKPFHSYFNNRSEFSQKLVGEELIKSYFEFWNVKMYRESCSLLSKKNCLSSTKSQLKSFAQFWEKTKKWYENIQIQKRDSYLNTNIYCVSYSYKLRYDLNDTFITETFQYRTESKDWYEQIIQRLCEQIKKWEKNIKCPFVLNTYYCK